MKSILARSIHTEYDSITEIGLWRAIKLKYSVDVLMYESQGVHAHTTFQLKMHMYIVCTFIV